MPKPKILHIAPLNTSGVPGQFVLAERALGYQSRLVTLFNDERDYFRDICLNLPFVRLEATRWIKKYVSNPEKLVISNRLEIPEKIPPVWTPHTTVEKILIGVRDFLWKPIIESAIKKYQLYSFDIVQLDGGLGFYRNSSFVRRMFALGKKIICCYTGSDLRTRGLIPAIDKISSLNVSVEFDHLLLHPNIHHVFFPFNAEKFAAAHNQNRRVRIGHAPTNRAAKGSDVIIPILRQLETELEVEMLLIENMPYRKALALKQTCDIFVDQIGDLGYGINSLESLAMGIVTCSCLAPGFEQVYPDHPFIVINKENLKQRLTQLITDSELRKKKSGEGREWVRKYHKGQNAVKKIHQLAGIGT